MTDLKSVDLLEDIAAELDYVEAMRHATALGTHDGLEWPELRREILSQGGIGPSSDWPADAWPGDLYRRSGKAPDLVAVDTYLGRSDQAPWQGTSELTGADDAMRAYLWRAYGDWKRSQAAQSEQVKHRAPKAEPPRKLRPGERSFAELLAELRKKHGADVDLSGLRSEYVKAYESGERITRERDGRSYRGTVGATRGPRPRFVLLLSMDL